MFTLAFAGYITVAARLVFSHGYLPGDALARVGNAYGAITGRDPHLAAIGFVWSPLPTAAIGALLPFRLAWPALVTHGFAACIVSAAAMAATAVVIRGILADLGLGVVPRLIVVALVAAHPMFVWYGANGMSEAVGLLFLCLACRSLVRWLEHHAVGSLVGLGLALAGAYLSRYEAIAASGIVAVVVATGSFRRAPGRRADRARHAMLDAGLVCFIVIVAVAGWAGLSWLIVKHPFEQFASVYGNSAQVAASHATIDEVTGGQPLTYVGDQVAGLEPLLWVAVALAVMVALLRRRAAVLAAIVVLAPVMATQAALAEASQTFVWLRFQIGAVPLAGLCVGSALAPSAMAPDRGRLGRWSAAVSAAVVAALLLGPALPAATHTLLDRRLAREEAGALRALMDPTTATARERAGLDRLAFGHVVARDLSDYGLGRGEVLTDTAFAFPIVLAAEDPTWFVVRSDRDFEAALAKPWVFGVRYLLVPAPTGRAAADAVNVEYPGLWAGHPGASLIREWQDPTGNHWGLFAVTPPTLSPAPAPQTPSTGEPPAARSPSDQAAIDHRMWLPGPGR